MSLELTMLPSLGWSDSKCDEVKITPVCCVIGHVDVGKTKLLDYLRGSVTKEVSGITQQIGATFYSAEALKNLSDKLIDDKHNGGIIIIDTPGHECFSLMRKVGIEVADVTILVVDIIKGIERETVNSIKILCENNKKFIIALNKLDKIYGWNSTPKSTLKNTFKNQLKDAMDKLNDYCNKIKLQLLEEGINALEYWNMTSHLRDEGYVQIVPVSAVSGEGISDLLASTYKMGGIPLYIDDREIEGYVVDKRNDVIFGDYYMCINKKGVLTEGQKLYVGDDELTIKFLISMEDNTEMKDKTGFKRCHEIVGARGCGVVFEETIPVKIGSGYANVSDLKHSKSTITCDISAQLKPLGLTIIAQSESTIHALFNTLNTNKIPVGAYEIGGLTKKIIMKAGLAIYNKHGVDYEIAKLHSIILLFDPVFSHSAGDSTSENTDDALLVKNIDASLLDLTKTSDVKIIAGNTIYKLYEKYMKYRKGIIDKLNDKYGKLQRVKMQIIPKYIFTKTTPLLFGVKILEGKLSKGMKICTINAKNIKVSLGNVVGLQKDKKDVEEGNMGDEICVKIGNHEHKIEYGKDFDETCVLMTDNDSQEMVIYGKVKQYLVEKDNEVTVKKPVTVTKDDTKSKKSQGKYDKRLGK